MPADIGVMMLRLGQRTIQFVNGPHGWRDSSLFYAVQCFRTDAGTLSQLNL